MLCKVLKQSFSVVLQRLMKTSIIPNHKNTFKCVVLGYTQAGKTSLLRTYIDERFPGDCGATAYSLYSVEVSTSESSALDLKLWDTSGLVSNDYISRLYYPDTDVFLICFSVADSGYFEKIPERWLSHLRMCCPNAPIVLVGTKVDLRANKEYLRKWNLKALTYEQGQQMADELGAVEYLECSALEEKGVAEVFEALAKACNQYSRANPIEELSSEVSDRTSTRCSIL